MCVRGLPGVTNFLRAERTDESDGECWSEDKTEGRSNGFEVRSEARSLDSASVSERIVEECWAGSVLSLPR